MAGSLVCMWDNWQTAAAHEEQAPHRSLTWIMQRSFRLQVMHSDLKTKNVLLSSAMNAKISDVGLAQLVDAHSENAPVLAL
jgi:serine/threonine protein kinase